MSVELNTIAPKKWVDNYSGVAPTIDTTNGVSVGDFAVDTTDDAIWRCTDNSAGTPVWIDTAAGRLTLVDSVNIAGQTSVNITGLSAGVYIVRALDLMTSNTTNVRPEIQVLEGVGSAGRLCSQISILTRSSTTVVGTALTTDHPGGGHLSTRIISSAALPSSAYGDVGVSFQCVFIIHEGETRFSMMDGSIWGENLYFSGSANYMLAGYDRFSVGTDTPYNDIDGVGITGMVNMVNPTGKTSIFEVLQFTDSEYEKYV